MTYRASGDDFVVNTIVQGSQREPQIIALTSGNFLVTWYSATDNQNYVSQAQIFRADGTRVGSEFDFTSSGNAGLAGASFAPLPDGGFVATWVDNSGGFGNPDTVKMQVFGSNGIATGSEVTVAHPVHTSLDTITSQASITILSSGDYLVSWAEILRSGSQVASISSKGQLYHSDGSTSGAQLNLASVDRGLSSDREQDVASLVSGGFAVSWNEDGDLFTQSYGTTGIAISATLQVGLDTDRGYPSDPQVVGLANGGYAVVWANFDRSGQFFYYTGLHAQIFNAQGQVVSAELNIDPNGPAQIFSIGASALASGGFVVTWAAQSGDGDGISIMAQTFDGTGLAPDGPFVVNTTIQGDQIQTTVSTLASGDFVISWSDPSRQAPDPQGFAVRARIFSAADFAMPAAVHNDFNGDGRSDVLWRNTGGAMSDWLGKADGGFTQNDANAFAQVPNDWQIAGTGDFNGDGRSDIVWRSTGGAVSDWLANANGGFTSNDANALSQVPTSWHVAGTGDFNGDGHDDILWRNDSGTLSDWLGKANGGFTQNDANALSQVPTNWHVAGTGDFNGDGRDDILWRSDSGAVSDWLGRADGGFTTNDAAAFSQVPTDWHIAGTGDFNGDGRDDILWRNDNGTLSDWLAKADGGFTTNDAAALTQVPTSWHVADTGDYNGDGRADILWRSDSGALSDWLGKANGGFTQNDAAALAQVPTSWHVQGHDYLVI